MLLARPHQAGIACHKHIGHAQYSVIGHARTNPGHAAGRDLMNTVDCWSQFLLLFLDLRTRQQYVAVW